MSNQIPQLQFVNVELTLKCNFRCLHCGSTAGKPRSNELKFNEWISVMKQLTELGCHEVCILGGEPFLMPEWFAIAQIICDLGMNLVIITNGWFIEQQIADQLKTLKRLDRIGVSLDGATPEVHDNIRGRRKSFQKALNALWLLRDAGFEVGAITSVSKLNLSELFRIRDLLVGQNITWQLQGIAAHGQRWNNEWNINPGQFYQIVEFIARSRETFGVDLLPIAGSHGFGYFSERLTGYAELPYWPGCAAGIASLGICSSGYVKPCLSLPDSKIIGNLKEESLRAIWEDSARFRRTRMFHQDMLKGFCRECPHSLKCRGGCPNLPIAYTGSDADNPFCCYRMEKQGHVPPDPIKNGWL